MRKLAPKRTCEGCDLCCTVAGVAVLNKPPGQRCRHLTALAPAGRNCLIYERRPADCRSFQCVWRASDTALTDEFRPAKCGFALWIGDAFKWPLVITVGVDPARPDAWDTPWARARFTALAFELNALVAIGQGVLASHIFTPLGAVYAKADLPELFIGGGLQIGAPDFDFRPNMRATLAEIGEALLGYAEA
jgi:hypothetical protein